MSRRYCDNAATTWPKPECVWESWSAAARQCGASAGRGGYSSALKADRLREAARVSAARLLRASVERVALVPSATIGLNMVIHGLLEDGDHVIATTADHNATLRPVHAAVEAGRATCSFIRCDEDGQVDVRRIVAAVGPATRWIVLAHGCNVTGAVQDVSGLAEGLGTIGSVRPGIILDASQTAGLFQFDVAALGADVVVAPTHKWIHGMAGVGLMWAREGIEPRAVLQGGTGHTSDQLTMPSTFIQRMEPGSADTPALAALTTAIEWLEKSGLSSIGSACRDVADACALGLREIGGVRVLHAPGGAPIVAFAVEGYHPQEVAIMLEQMAAIEVRSGLHCAGLFHSSIGIPAGTIRASFGPFNTHDDAERIVAVIRGLAAKKPKKTVPRFPEASSEVRK